MRASRCERRGAVLAEGCRMHSSTLRSFLCFMALGAASSAALRCNHAGGGDLPPVEHPSEIDGKHAEHPARQKASVDSMAGICDGSDGPRLVAQSYGAMARYPSQGLAEGIVVDGHCNAWAFDSEVFSSGPLSKEQQAAIETALWIKNWKTKGGDRWSTGVQD